MTRSLLIALALAPLGTAALAQSAASTNFAPTLFGIIDVNARLLHNGSSGTYKSEGTDGLSSSRLGVRGNEDLGDGLKANFWLEAGVNADTGTSNATKFFNRRSTVSLISPGLGELRVGRDYTPLFTAYAVYDPFGTNGLGEIVGTGTVGAIANGVVNAPGTGIVSALGSGSQTLTRADNQVSYFLPTNLGGVYGQIAAAPSEGVTGGRYVGGRLGYGKGPFDISAGYEETRVALNDKFKQAHVGVSYNFGVLVLSGQYLQSRYDSRAVVDGDRKQQVAQIGVTVPFGANVVRASFIHGDMSGGAGNSATSGFRDADDADQLSLGYQYNLSKRTALYSVASQLRNKGNSRQVVATSARTGFRPGEKSSGIDFGVRHTF